jgi:hypothetical protein
MVTVDAFPFAELAEALFLSPLQESQHPTSAQIRDAVAAVLAVHRQPGIAASVAQEAGDHPELCQHRMQWALRMVATAYQVVAIR